MARDFEDLHDTDDLSDDELRELVRTHLADNNGIDVDDISIRVEDGVVHLGGRVGTEAEMRIAEHVVTDTLGLVNVSNELVVDPIRRAVSPDAIDDHLADEEAHEGLLLGDRAVPLSPEVEEVRDDLDERLFGTSDVQKSIADGASYTPPTSPTPEGLGGTDAGPGAMGEDH
ncbi:MAG TPA: BON domain-containing protein [Gemmatimonadaceae bacterium]|nr:BON domain-containing protein [Gemmatimonadaceae bacterium]